MHANRLAYLFLFGATFFWGGNTVAGKLAVGHLSPFLLVFIRWSMAVAILAAFALGDLRRDWPVIRRNLPLLVTLGAIGLAGFNVTFYFALNYTTAINAGILQAATPVVIFAANFLLFRQRVSALQIAGFALTLLGVVLTVTRGDLGAIVELAINRGDMIMMIAVVIYGGYAVLLRYKPQLHWRSMMLVLAFSALLFSIPFAAWEVMTGRAIAPDMQGWAVVTYTAIGPAILSQVFFIRGVEAIGSNRAGPFMNMVPIFGTMLSIMILGEAFRPYHAAALVLVIFGIWLSERRAH